MGQRGLACCLDVVDDQVVVTLGLDPVEVADGADGEPAQEAVSSPATATLTATPQALRMKPTPVLVDSHSVNVDAEHRREA